MKKDMQLNNYQRKVNIKMETSGITLIALIVTIIVLLILAGVSIATLMGDNGIITNANLAKISTEFAGYKEEVEIFKTSKISENYNFKEDSLTAGQTTLEYEGKPVEETGNIKTIIQNLDDKYLDKFIIIKGILYLMVTEEVSNTEIKAAENTGIEIMPYEISEEGELLSSNVNLALQGSEGTLVVPDIVTSIGNCAFEGASNLTKINLPDSISYIGWRAFRSANLNTVIIPKNVKEISSDTFNGNINLRTVIMQEGLERIGTNTLNATKISELIFPSTLETIDGTAFTNCNNLDKFNLDNNEYFVYESGMLMKRSKETIIYISSKFIQNLTTFEIPEGIETINNNAFNYCSRLIKVEIPSTVKTIGANCFADATNNLEEIIIHNTEGSIQGAPWGAVKGMRVVQWVG